MDTHVQWKRFDSPVHIAQVQYELHEIYATSWIARIRTLGDQMHNQTNLQCAMTAYDALLKERMFLPLVDLVHRTCSTHLDAEPDVPYAPLEMWGAIYRPGNYAKVHNHGRSIFSFCYYLKCDDQSSPLIFRDLDLEVQPKEGLLVVFPSHLHHHVPTLEAGERIIIAGNV